MQLVPGIRRLGGNNQRPHAPNRPAFVSAPPDDEDLVRSALSGDAQALDRLVERYAPRAFRMVRARVSDAVVVEDLVQETFLRAILALPTFRFGARFFTWFYRIMLNTVTEHQRTSARRRELDVGVRPQQVTAPAADDSSERREEREGVWRALAELPEEFRAALLLREWDGLPYAEIARALGCSIGTVSSRIARARQMLHDRLAP